MVYKVQYVKEYDGIRSIEDLHRHGSMIQEVEVKIHYPENKTPILKLIRLFPA